MTLKQSRGFTLLESIVALVILSTSCVAIYSWLSTSLDGLRRVDDTVTIKLITDDLGAYFRTVTIENETEETLTLNGYQVDWMARLVEPKQLGRHPMGTSSNFILGLYQIDAIVSKDNREVGQFKTRTVSFKNRSNE
ncbi:MAG: hypothetical protein CMQ15_14905 [Gammaproteobacteria bacterium]|jgi:prepilin-type N-terminal cleavage/methylation domain-containing protein|nr:hypothetical protein [Gammaproteobacteria bacterium]|tara:strand:+ start:2099 stop:2509 length:411 start_codon:yes stop_codon:yes gene_type:complete